jgi:hypothetical protein
MSSILLGFGGFKSQFSVLCYMIWLIPSYVLIVAWREKWNKIIESSNNNLTTKLSTVCCMLRTLQVLHVTLQETCIFCAVLGKCFLCSEYIYCWYLEKILLTYMVPCLVIADRRDWWEQIQMGMHMAKWESYNVGRSIYMMLFFFFKKIF